MKNHWLEEKKNKKLGDKIEELLMDTWADTETIGTFLERLTEEDDENAEEGTNENELKDFFTSYLLEAIDSDDNGEV